MHGHLNAKFRLIGDRVCARKFWIWGDRKMQVQILTPNPCTHARSNHRHVAGSVSFTMDSPETT